MNINIKSFIFLTIAICSIILGSQSCYYDKYEDLNPKTDTLETCDTLNVTYSGSIKAILDTKCVNCHSDAGTQTGPYMSTYDEAKIAMEFSNIIGRVELPTTDPQFMPQGGIKLSDCNISLLKVWENQNFKQ